jgi:hypothetical protein
MKRSRRGNVVPDGRAHHPASPRSLRIKLEFHGYSAGIGAQSQS